MRHTLHQLRRGFDHAVLPAWDRALGGHVLDWCASHQVTTLGVYWPLAGEPELGSAYAALAARGVALLLPVVVEKHAPLAFAAWTPGEAMVKDKMGVAVPLALRLRELPPALLVPCLGFNAGRLRLGYGGGYYDRTLAVEAARRPLCAGVAYACQVAEFSGDPHDVALDTILTEAGPR